MKKEINPPMARPKNEISSVRLFLMGVFIAILCLSRLLGHGASSPDLNPLAQPVVGSSQLRILSPSLLELNLIQTKAPAPARFSQWDFINDLGAMSLPLPGQYVVMAGTQRLNVRAVGFKRRPIYAPLAQRDLRVATEIYLDLLNPVPPGAVVTVSSTVSGVILSNQTFSAVMDPYRWNPAIHVNQEGYLPAEVKKVSIGYYLGSLGEMPAAGLANFQVINQSNTVVFTGPLVQRRDVGYTITPLPYQQVLEGTFTAVPTGQYRIFVSGLGVSFPFSVHEGMAANFTRTYARGMYHQRCGTDNVFPFSRHTHAACHVAPAFVPTSQSTHVNQTLSLMSSDFARNPRHTAPQLSSVGASLYPFVNLSPVNVSGGHHDAGDYSKYTLNVAALVHSLIFAADVFTNVAALDNLGLPESGNRRGDLLEEVKWEADFLSRMQDADGGFYFLVYPRDRAYENNVLPDRGDPQVVFPKNTAATAAAVAALAQMASSPRFKLLFPDAASNYLAKARMGWSFLTNAQNRFGRDGSYQKISHYGNEFLHDDEIAWAATEMFLATGEESFHSELMSRFDPSSASTRRWGWWRLYEGYGNAIRSYAFAARSGRLPASRLNPTFLTKCETEIRLWGAQQAGYSQENAYGTSFPRDHKIYRNPGWYFSMDRAFDMVVSYQLTGAPAQLEAIIANLNFEAGLNPLNLSFISGLGQRQGHEMVHQYAQNDRRPLPPTGLTFGNLQYGFANLSVYQNELSVLCHPRDDASTNPYAPYDVWTDSYHMSTELVAPQLARSLATAAFLMGRTSLKEQSWIPALAPVAMIQNLPAQSPAGQSVTAQISIPGIDLSQARILWEARSQQPRLATNFSFVPAIVGVQWVEAEVRLPDGRRFLAVTNFNATYPTNGPAHPQRFLPQTVNSEMAALFHFDGYTDDATGKNTPLGRTSRTTLDGGNVGWMNPRSGTALRFEGYGQTAGGPITQASYWKPNTEEIVVESMIYLTELQASKNQSVKLISLRSRWDASLELHEDEFAGLKFVGGINTIVDGPAVSNALPLHQWHLVRMSVNQTGYRVWVNGVLLASLPSADLVKWSEQGAQLQLGNFEGWIDELVIKSFDGAPRAPSVSPPGGTFSAPVAVTLQSDTVGAMIRYTLNGNEPDGFSTAYSGPLTLASNVVVKTRAFTNGLGSPTTSAAFTIRPPATAPLISSPLSRRLPNGDFEIYLAGTVGQQIYLEASSDFRTWNRISTNILSGSSVLFLDSTARNFPSRFYRAVLAP